jgi:hypothetical protein
LIILIILGEEYNLFRLSCNHYHVVVKLVHCTYS